MEDIFKYFKSIVDTDGASIVVCDNKHDIIYMNAAAIENYSKRGGAALIGKSIFDCHNERSCELIKRVTEWFSKSEKNNKVHTYYNEKQNKDVYMIALRDGDKYIGYYEKHEFRNRDTSPFYEI